MAKQTWLYLLAFLTILGCKKANDAQVDESQKIHQTNYRKTIDRMIEVTKVETQRLKSLTAQIRSGNQRITGTGEQFAQQQLQNYCQQLFSLEPQHLEQSAFQVNIPDVDWANDPGVMESDASTILPQPMTQILDRVENNVMAIVENPIYEQNDNLAAAITDVKNAIELEKNNVDQTAGLSQVDKEGMKIALEGAKDLAGPQADYLNALAEASFAMGIDPNTNWRLFRFLGRVVRAVARVAIMVAAAAVVTAAIIKTAGAFAPVGSKLALKIKGKTLTNLAFKGVKYKTKVNLYQGGTANVIGGFSMPGALVTGGAYGVIAAYQKWNKPMPADGNWWNEFKISTKIYP